jgi:GNAT superfamily N-acetyltransferase
MFHATDRWFFAATGSDHVDMNQAALFGEADAEDAALLASQVVKAGVPCLLGCSDGVLERAAPALTAAGFARLPNREAIFWRPGPPPSIEPAGFEVRRVRSDVDVVAMLAIFEEAHGYDPTSIAALYGGRIKGDDGFSAWLAWDGPDPISFTIVVEVGTALSIWEVMTPERHRRRGGARAVVNAALAGAAAVAARTIEETLFWASPAGRPLYEAMGFVVADEVDAWALGASAEDLAAVGA